MTLHDSIMLPDGLDPGVRPVLEYIARVHRPWREAGHIAGRQALEAAAIFDRPMPPSVHAVDDAIALADRNIPIRVYTPGGSPRGVILFFHGGGFVLGGLQTHHALCGRLAHEASATLIAVDYRLAPENPFPAAVDDALAALEWLTPQIDRIGGEAAGCAIVGDSAGGNLAAVATQHAAASGNERVRLQVLIYPVTDFTITPDVAPSLLSNADGLFLTLDDMRWFNDMYRPERESPLASPARATSLQGLPRTLVITAEFDPLRDDGERYASLLQRAGVDVTLRRYGGQIHGFMSMSALVSAADDALKEVAGAIQHAVR